MRLLAPALAVVALVPAAPAPAWGNEGHQAIATIARSHLTPAVRAKVDALLASDTNNLTAHDMASEATWADAWRNSGHRETAGAGASGDQPCHCRRVASTGQATADVQ